MSLRKKPEARCAHCKMRKEFCICPLIPSLDLATKVIIIVARREVHCPTNTGRLAAQALVNSALLVRGIQDRPYDIQEQLMPERRTLLLYPADDAKELSSEMLHEMDGACNLIVPDGSWRQTAKMRRRDPFLAGLPTIKLPTGRPSVYGVRKESKLEGLATIEAIARALGILESPLVQKRLEQLLAAMVSRVLQSRGTHLDPPT